MKTKFALFVVLGLLTTLLTLNDLPLFAIHHEISLAYANNPDNNGNHYGNDNNDGNHYAYGQSGGNNHGIQGDPAATVPEPSTLLLFGAGLAGVGLLRKKMRK